MMKPVTLLMMGMLCLATASLAVADWPNFRGPNGDSSAVKSGLDKL